MRPAAGEGVLAIVGGDVYVGNGVVFRRGTVLCRGSKIEAVGPALEVPEGARIIDATGQRVLPGFVAPKGGNFGIQRGRPRSGERPFSQPSTMRGARSAMVQSRTKVRVGAPSSSPMTRSS